MARKKQNPFKGGIQHMLDVSGVTCYTLIGGTPTTFKGIYDEVARTEVDGGLEVLVNETALTVKRAIANSLAVNQDLSVEVEVGETPLKYRIRDKQPIEDGSLVQLYLGKRTDVTQPDPYEEAEDEWEDENLI